MNEFLPQVDVLIPSVSIPAAIMRDLVKVRGKPVRGDEDVDGEVIRVVRARFHEAWRANAALLDGLAGHGRIEVEIQDDMGEPCPECLASLDVRRTFDTGVPRFTVSSHLAYPDLLAAGGLGSKTYDLTHRGYWSHELVHLADLALLASRHRLAQARGGRDAPGFSALLAHGGRAPDGEIAIVAALGAYRDEGLARLYEHLRGESEPKIQPEDAVQAFRKSFLPVLSNLSLARLAGDERVAYGARAGAAEFFGRFLEESRKASYHLGPVMVLDAIHAWVSRSDDLAPIREPLAQAIRAAGEGRSMDVGADHAAAIIRAGLRTDLGFFLELLGTDDLPHPLGPFLRPAEIAPFRPLLFPFKDEDHDASTILPRLVRAMLHGERDLYLSTVREVVGSWMDEAEIESGYETWQQTFDLPGESEIEHEIRRLAADLVNRLRAAPAPTAQADRDVLLAALTYLLDPEDAVADKVPFYGWLDDLYVLRGAEKMVGACP